MSALPRRWPTPSITPPAGASASCRSASRNCWRRNGRRPLSADLIRAYAARLDRAGPLVDLAFHELSEILRRGAIVWHERGSETLHPFAHRGRLHGLHDRAVEPAHDVIGCAFGQEDGAPGIGLHVGALLERGR